MPAEKPSFMPPSSSEDTSSIRVSSPLQPTSNNFGGVPVNRPVSRTAPTGLKEKIFRSGSVFEGIITVSLVALFFGIPVFFTGLTFQGIAFDKQLYFYFWLLVAIIAWVSKGVISGEMRIRRTPLDIPILLLWLFSILSAFLGIDRWHSFWGFFGDPSRGVVSLTALILAYYLILSHFTPKRFYAMFSGLLVAGFVVALWSTLVVLKVRFLPESWETMAPLSLIGTLSTLTTFLALLLPLFMTGIFVMWQKEAAWKKIARTVLTAFLGLGILMVLFLLLALYAYVAWPVVLIGLSFFMVYILAQIVRPGDSLTWIPMVTFVIVLAFLMIGGNKLARATLPVEVAPNVNLSWQIAKESVKNNFFLGAGPGNYGYAFSMYKPLEYNQNDLYTLRFYQGNGLFFEYLSTVGVPGTILLAVLWLAFISLGVYLLSLEKSRNKVYSLGLWTTALMFLVAGLTTSMNGTLVLLAALLGTLALGVVFWESAVEPRYLQLSLKAAPKFALALAFIFMVVSAGVAFLFVFMGKVLVADLSAGKAARMAVAGPSTDVVNLLVSATQRYPQEGRYFIRLGQEFMALANVEAAKPEAERNTDTVANYVRSAVVASEVGRNLMPNDVVTVESLGLVYENASLYATDALPKAEELYSRAKELEPQNPLYAIKLGQIKRTLGDTKEEGAEKTALYNESTKFFEEAVTKKANLAVAHYQVALAYSRLKNYDQAIKSTQEAMRLDPNNVNYQYNLGVIYQIRDDEGDEARAEETFKNILAKNDKLVDVRLSLGLLYEKMNRDSDAISEYQKILDLLPEEEGNVAATRDQIRTLITNVQSGRGNLEGAASAPVTPEAGVEGSQIPAVGPQTTPSTNSNSSSVTEPQS